MRSSILQGGDNTFTAICSRAIWQFVSLQCALLQAVCRHYESADHTTRASVPCHCVSNAHPCKLESLVLRHVWAVHLVHEAADVARSTAIACKVNCHHGPSERNIPM